LRRDVLTQALTVSGAGALLGLMAAFGTSRILSSILFEVSPTDPLALAAACGALLVVAVIAAYGPARRATRIDPAIALRAD
jgi:ABC-type antimicrobial peptide transport system permease subunit